MHYFLISSTKPLKKVLTSTEIFSCSNGEAFITKKYGQISFLRYFKNFFKEIARITDHVITVEYSLYNWTIRHSVRQYYLVDVTKSKFHRDLCCITESVWWAWKHRLGGIHQRRNRGLCMYAFIYTNANCILEALERFVCRGEPASEMQIA